MAPEYSMEHGILEKVRKLEKDKHFLYGLAEIYCELLQIQMEAESSATVIMPNLDEHLRRERLRAGIPLLLFKDFHPDWNQVGEVFNRIIEWSAKDVEAFREIDHLKKIRSDPGLLRAAAEVWYRGQFLRGLPAFQERDCELLASIIGAALKPFLLVYSKALLPEVEQELWRRNYCPVCGGKPDFSALKEGGKRWLLCSRCDGEWLFSRIECPYCGTQNQGALAYFSGEEQSEYRMYVCEECHTYLKGIDSKVSGAEALLPLERVLTLDLDRQGRKRGYEAGWAVPGGIRDFS